MITGNVLEQLFPRIANLVDNTTIHVLSPECIGPELLPIANGIADAAWTANLVTYIPFYIARPLLVAQFFWINAGTVNGNTDVGIYSEDGSTKLGSTGATANSGGDTMQKVNVADFVLPANRRLWLALGSDSGTQSYYRSNLVAAGLDYVGVKQQSGGYSSGLPSSATFATPAVANTPIFGFTGQSVI